MRHSNDRCGWGELWLFVLRCHSGVTLMSFSSRWQPLTRHVPKFNSTHISLPISFLASGFYIWSYWMIYYNQNIRIIKLSIMVLVLCVKLIVLCGKNREQLTHSFLEVYLSFSQQFHFWFGFMSFVLKIMNCFCPYFILSFLWFVAFHDFKNSWLQAFIKFFVSLMQLIELIVHFVFIHVKLNMLSSLDKVYFAIPTVSQ